MARIPVKLARRASLVFLTKILARLILIPFFRLQIEGLDRLPTTGRFILLPKHQRWEDIPLIALATPRPLYYMAKAELFRNACLGRFLVFLGGIPLNRARPLESRCSLRSMIDVLEEGEGVAIFPEGTYFRNRMGPGRKGLIKMVRSRLRVPFIPVGIRYGQRGRRTEVRIRYGRPLTGEAAMDMDDLQERIMGEIARLSGLAVKKVI